MFEAIGMKIVKTRACVGQKARWTVKTRGFVGPDVHWTVKARGLRPRGAEAVLGSTKNGFGSIGRPVSR